jgi:outer membrane protein
MKKLPVLVSGIAIVISILSVLYIKQSSELVYIDVSRVLDGYTRTKIVRAEFEKKAELLNSNVDSLVANWREEIKAYEKDRVSMSKKELELKQQLLSNKQQQINSYQQAIQKQIQEEDQKSTQTVLNDINDYVKEYGEQHGYRIIFGASGGGNIMFASEGSDLTEEVINGLNLEFEALPE